MALQQKIPVLPPKNAVFDFFDLALGVGYKKFFAVHDGEKTNIATTEIRSQKILEQQATANTTLNLPVQYDLDWDLEVSQSILISGDLIVNVPVESITALNGFRLDVIVYSVNGAGTETEIASKTGSAIDLDQTVSSSTVLTTKVNIPFTVFKAGQKLRINTRIFHRSINGSNRTSRIWFSGDPGATTESNQNNPVANNSTLNFKNKTTITFLVPLKIEN